jgi:multiple sugar transport system ATP-binding protein
MSSVQLKKLSKSFGRIEAVRGVTLDIADREFIVFVGPSGCGKSTLLRMIAGLEEVSGGELFIGDKKMNEVDAADRGIAMVFQSYALYPHMTVRENIGFGLKMAGEDRKEVARKVAEAASTLQIDELLERRPRELSGGQRQRVAIGRAIVKEPKVFLFDEPLSNLDADLRGQMRVEIARLHKSLGSTVVYVTHDQVEAMTLADRIVVMRDGKVEQVGTPAELYSHPANTFVAGFIGQPKMNFISATVRSVGATNELELPSGALLRVPGTNAPLSPGKPVTFGIRPADVSVSFSPSEESVRGEVELVEHLGDEILAHIRIVDSDQVIVAAQEKKARIAVSDKIALHFDQEEAHYFDSDGRRL